MDTQSYVSKGYVQFLMTLALVGVIVALASYAHLTLKKAQGIYTGEATISVSGKGEVLAKPDIGTFSFSVRAEGADAKTAQDASAKATNAILDYLKEVGVAEKDVKTQNYSLNPKYRYEERVCVAGSFCPPGNRVLDGYEVYQSVSVKVRDLDSAGDLISGVGERGATNLSGLQFTIDDEDALKAEAREKAIGDAKEKAEKLAKDLGMHLGRIVDFSENENGFYPRPYATEARSFGGAVDEAAIAPQVPTGENTITSQVNITYELR